MTTLLEFPCHFQIKVFGKNDPAFVLEISNIAKKHFPNTRDTEIQTRVSRQSTYLALTITVLAENKASLDALYMELTQHPEAKMVL